MHSMFFVGIITFCSDGIGSQNVKKRGRGPVRALKVIAKCKSTKLHGNGYLAKNPT
jgi:hypothetical protein